MANHEGSASSLSAEEIARLSKFIENYSHYEEILDPFAEQDTTEVTYTDLDKDGIAEYLQTQAPDGMVESWTSR